MCKVKDRLNSMLTRCGGDELKDDYYWSSTEFSGSNAWRVYLSNGGVNGWRTKASLQLRVRPVSAFSL
jgi:hypothetical protein